MADGPSALAADARVERWTPERRRERTRTALLEAAAYVFARRGFHGASLDDIAETAGFTRGAIYNNFAGKEELFLAVVDRHHETARRAYEKEILEGAAEAALDAKRMAALWREVVAGDADYLALELEFRLYAMRNPEVRERFAAHRREQVRIAATSLERVSQAVGLGITIEPEELAGILIATGEGFAQAAAIDPAQAEFYETFVELLNRAVSTGGRRKPAKGGEQSFGSVRGAGRADSAR